MQGFLGHGFGKSGKGAHLLIGERHAGVRQPHGLKADRNLTGGFWTPGWRSEAKRWSLTRTHTRVQEPIKSSMGRSLGHLLQLYQSVPSGGGDQGDSGEESSNPKPSGAFWQLELPGRITRFKSSLKIAAMGSDERRSEGSTGH
jgi:hypothetical protein